MKFKQYLQLVSLILIVYQLQIIFVRIFTKVYFLRIDWRIIISKAVHKVSLEFTITWSSL